MKSLNDFSKHIKQHSLTVDTYNNMSDCNHALGLPLKSFPNLRHLEKSLRRRSKSIVQPEEIEAKLILQNKDKRKKHSLIEQHILKINVAKYSKNELKQRLHIIRRKSLAQFPSCKDLSKFGYLSSTSVKPIEVQTQIKLKKDLMIERIKRDQQSYKQIQNQFQLKLKDLEKIKGQIQKNRLQLNTIKSENSKILQAEQILQRKIVALQEQIEIKSKQKKQIIQVFPCLKDSFEVQKYIKEYMSQKQKKEMLQTLQLRLKDRDHKIMTQKKQLQNCSNHSEKHLLIYLKIEGNIYNSLFFNNDYKSLQ